MFKNTSPQRIFGIILIIVGLLIIVANHLFQAYQFYDEKSIISELALALAGASITSGIFSVCLSFSEFIEYTTNVLCKILIDDTYISKLTEESKRKIRFRLDSSVYGENATDPKQGPYSFLSEIYPKLYSNPYRTAYTDTTTYFYNNSCDMCNNQCTDKLNRNGLICVHNNTSYNLHFEHIPTSELVENKFIKFSVGFEDHFYNPDVAQKIKTETSTLGTPAPSFSLSSGDDYPFMNCETVKSLIQRFNVSIKTCSNKNFQTLYKYSISNGKINFINSNENIYIKASTITYDFDCENKYYASVNFRVDFLLDATFFDGIARIAFEMLTLECAENHYNTLTLSYPTHGMDVTYTIAGGRKFIVKPSAFTLNWVQPEYLQNINHAKITIHDWLLPGHGCGISWIEVPSSTAPTIEGK